MIHLYWIRPGESIDCINREFSYKHVNRSLTSRGIVQARQTADRFGKKKISVLYSSPLKQAIETADIFKIRMSLPIIPLESFRDINVGSLEKSSGDENSMTIYQQVMDSWQKGDKSVRFPEGEDFYMLSGRMQEGLKHIATRNTSGNIIVVGHAGPLRATIRYLCPGKDLREVIESPILYCSITDLGLEIIDGKLVIQLEKWAAHDHLSGDASNFESAFLS
jgi:broad specificity phosphatase PhoE